MLTAMVAVLSVWLALATLRVGRAVPLTLVRRAMEAAQLLAQRFDIAFIRCLLSFGLFQHFQDLVQLFERLAQRSDDLHDLVDGFVNRFRVRRMLCGCRGRRSGLVCRPSDRGADCARALFFCRLIGNFHVG